MLMTTLHVALGGALGAALRFLIGACVTRWAGAGFPLATLGVNILGSFAMGLFVVYAAKTANTHFNPFVMTGILGGFTTFSAFSLDAVTLMERGAIAAAGLYILLSLLGSILALTLGLWIARSAFA